MDRLEGGEGISISEREAEGSVCLACLKICKEARVIEARSVAVARVRMVNRVGWGQGDDAGPKTFESFERETHDLDHNLFCLGKDCKVPRVAKERKVMRLLQEPR